MQVVDTITPMIFIVPTEGAEAHPHVHPRHLHPTDIAPDMSENRALVHRQIVEVPAVVGVLLVSGHEVAALVGGETRAVVHRVEVSAIFYSHVLVY